MKSHPGSVAFFKIGHEDTLVRILYAFSFVDAPQSILQLSYFLY